MTARKKIKLAKDEDTAKETYANHKKINTMPQSIVGYHFAADTLRDGTSLPAAGKSRAIDGDIKLCSWGFHASLSPHEALQHAPSYNCAKVALHGEVIVGNDKMCASMRTNITDYVDMARVVKEWALDCAELVLPIFEKEYPNDALPRAAIEAGRAYLREEITREELGKAVDAVGRRVSIKRYSHDERAEWAHGYWPAYWASVAAAWSASGAGSAWDTYWNILMITPLIHESYLAFGTNTAARAAGIDGGNIVEEKKRQSDRLNEKIEEEFATNAAN